MSVVIHGRVVEQLTRLRLRYVADRLDAVLNDAARAEPIYLDSMRRHYISGRIDIPAGWRLVEAAGTCPCAHPNAIIPRENRPESGP